MVNNGLKSPDVAVDNRPWPAGMAHPQQSERIFATKAALTQRGRLDLGAQKSFWLKRFLVY